ncbi:hypothetical protein BJY04DRAFT_220138 [Aspergillus karnatakaensis]|uniref:uncharacterized protein n=1 Tax=Aspergillus karnatakaensis TaxID=1810916 RepID=UPI003CCCB3CF
MGFNGENPRWEPISPDGLIRQEEFMAFRSGVIMQEGSDLITAALGCLMRIYLVFVQPRPFATDIIPGTATHLLQPEHIQPDVESIPSDIYDMMLPQASQTLDNAPQLFQFHPNASHPNASHPNASHPNASHPNASHPNASHTYGDSTRPDNAHFDSIPALRANLQKERDPSCISHKRIAWTVERIRIGEELLAFIQSSNIEAFEANGLSITVKVRRVAESLLLRDEDIPDDLASRASLILHELLVFLADMNRFSLQDTQALGGVE